MIRLYLGEPTQRLNNDVVVDRLLASNAGMGLVQCAAELEFAVAGFEPFGGESDAGGPLVRID